jgi:hypothetical protein
MKHKHAELIHAWADGAEIQIYSKELDNWINLDKPTWDFDGEYRIKPEEKKPVVRWLWATKHMKSPEAWRQSSLFMTAEELAEEYPDVVSSVRLEWSRTEFPE